MNTQNPFDAQDKIEELISEKLQEVGADVQGFSHARQGPVRLVTIMAVLTDPNKTLNMAEGVQAEADEFQQIMEAERQIAIQEKMEAERAAAAKAMEELEKISKGDFDIDEGPSELNPGEDLGNE